MYFACRLVGDALTYGVAYPLYRLQLAIARAGRRLRRRWDTEMFRRQLGGL